MNIKLLESLKKLQEFAEKSSAEEITKRFLDSKIDPNVSILYATLESTILKSETNVSFNVSLAAESNDYDYAMAA